jgi:hypothetical protein
MVKSQKMMLRPKRSRELNLGNVIPAVAPHIHVLTRHKRIHAQKSGHPCPLKAPRTQNLPTLNAHHDAA